MALTHSATSILGVGQHAARGEEGWDAWAKENFGAVGQRLNSHQLQILLGQPHLRKKKKKKERKKASKQEGRDYLAWMSRNPNGSTNLVGLGDLGAVVVFGIHTRLFARQMRLICNHGQQSVPAPHPTTNSKRTVDGRHAFFGLLASHLRLVADMLDLLLLLRLNQSLLALRLCLLFDHLPIKEEEAEEEEEEEEEKGKERQERRR